MLKDYRIVVDAMGGDNAPQAPVEGAALAMKKYPSLSVVFTGREPEIRKAMEGLEMDPARFTIIHKDMVVENEEHNPAEAPRKKRDSSMMYAMTMVKNHEADACISAGNTGAVLAGATLLVGRIPGVQRPALSVEFPGKEGPVQILDVGANTDSKASYLVQYAEMMTIYCRLQKGIEDPKVGLLNIGVEPGKGNALTKEVYDLLAQDPEIHFVGNVEARDVYDNVADILVTDGFAGNILLKVVEGTASYMLGLIKKEVSSKLIYKIGGLLIKPAFRNIKELLNPQRVGGTPLLGINGAVIKAHGNSNGLAYSHAIDQAILFLDSHVTDEIRECLKRGKEREKQAAAGEQSNE